MFNGWFAKHDTKDPLPDESENGSPGYGSPERSECLRRLLGPVQAATDPNHRKLCPPDPPPGTPAFEQIYQTAAVKPPRLTYGIQKVAEMIRSAHLAGMSPECKRKALLMALEAAGTDVGEVLNDVVTRQRALKEYEDSLLEQVNQFEADQLEQNRRHREELDKITAEFQSRIQSNLDEVERRHDEFRDWQKTKQQELQRFTEAASLCVPQEKAEEQENESRIMAIPQRATGTFR